MKIKIVIENNMPEMTPNQIIKENELLNTLMGILDTEKDSKVNPFDTLSAARGVLSELQSVRDSANQKLYQDMHSLCLYITSTVTARNVALNIANPSNTLSASSHSAYYDLLKNSITSKDASKKLTKDDVKNWVIPVLLENLEPAFGRNNDAKRNLDGSEINPQEFTPGAAAIRRRSESMFIPQEKVKEVAKTVIIDPTQEHPTSNKGERKKF